MGSEGGLKSWGPLHLAIHRGSAAEVRELLTKPGVDKEELLERAFTPLSLAAQYGRTDCIAEVRSVCCGEDVRREVFPTMLD